MKSLILLLFVFVSCGGCYAQYPIWQNLPSPDVLVRINAKDTLPNKWADASQAKRSEMWFDTIPASGSAIYIYDTINSVTRWIARRYSSGKWIVVDAVRALEIMYQSWLIDKPRELKQ